jgi:hypothetical protein
LGGVLLVGAGTALSVGIAVLDEQVTALRVGSAVLILIGSRGLRIIRAIRLFDCVKVR